ncbi:Translocon at the inner envelope membrane of chloroplasts 32 [Hyphodiscus hymeniophilus]|uniref:Translocon at the inner envelope membrane of chloroplasts 32 n=1 Tax=Hyphodiscus hymeniophilus TaxID=353542 RepID=A0A9P6VGE0_9HELO|nr:Translocon at the inner envelope membrane of chloroplasts 32 [Hyphodiscus hymeniophilus]
MPEYGFDTTAPQIVNDFPQNVKGKTFVITGASANSIGGNTALNLAAGNPASLVLLARDESKVSPVIKEIASLSPSTKAIFIPIDLSSQASIHEAASAITSSVSKIDVLINNAGVMAGPHKTTKEGIESQFGINHIGHFLLTNLLVPSIASGGRIVNVSSAGHAMGGVRFDDYNFQDGKTYDEWAAYGQSKTANVLFTVSLAEKLKSKKITAFSLHPGNAMTNLVGHLDPNTDWGMVMKKISDTGRPIPQFKSMDGACATTVAAALDPSLEASSGAYLDDCNPTPATPAASSAENAAKLWSLSEKLVGQKFEY